MRDFLDVTKALADQNRVRVLCALRGRELCVCQIIKLLGLAPSTVSKHMAILRQARLVEGRKQGRWTHYRLAGRDAGPMVRAALRWLKAALSEDRRILDDAQRIEQIIQIDPEELCRCMSKQRRMR